MIISDLNFCEILEVTNTIIGGASAKTDGEAIAGPGYATGYVTAKAFGDSTTTNARLFLTVRDKKYVTISKAKLKGYAFAEDKNGDKAEDKIWDFDFDIEFKI